MPDSLLTYDLRGDVAWIALDDGKANVFSPAMMEAMHAALDRAEQEAKVVVFAGRPGRFSGGFDLSIMKDGGMAAALAMVKGGGELALRLYGFPRPTLAAVTGHALAMGAMFLLACDRRIGAEGTFKIGLNESKIGMTLPVFGTELCRERLDPRHITDAAILGEIYNPTTACEVGFPRPRRRPRECSRRDHERGYTPRCRNHHPRHGRHQATRARRGNRTDPRHARRRCPQPDGRLEGTSPR